MDKNEYIMLHLHNLYTTTKPLGTKYAMLKRYRHCGWTFFQMPWLFYICTLILMG